MRPDHDCQVKAVVSGQQTDISDPFSVLRYRVSVAKRQQEYDEAIWRVKVESHYGKVEPLTIYSEDFDCEAAAKKDFDKNVAMYSDLVSAETKHWQDISIYAERIGYRKIDPDCCGNCAFAKLACACRCIGGKRKLECHNPENFREYDQLSGEHAAIDVHPEVSPDGICNNYQRG